MAVSVRKDAVLWYGCAAVCILVVLLVVAGCSMMTNNDSQNTGDNSGGGGDANAGSAAGSQQPVFFSLVCNLNHVTHSTSEPTTTIIKLSGDLPFRVDPDVLKLATSPVPLEYSNGEFGQSAGTGTKLNMYAEFDNNCNPGEQDCTPCHYTYNGPVEVTTTITHQPSDPPVAWSLDINDGGTFSDLDLNNELNQYLTIKEPSSDRCDPPGAKDVVVTSVITEAGNCWGTGQVPMTYGDGQEITFTPTNPEITLDSKAVFHYGTPAPTPTQTKGPKVITIVTTPTPAPKVSLAPLVTP
jgi:hypothetical protein